MSDAFAARAAQWDANPVRAAIGKAFYAQAVETLATHLGGNIAGRTVLEFGCGTGALGLRLAQEHTARLIFVDTSPAMLGVLRGKLAEAAAQGAQVFEGDLHSLPIPTASVDAVVSLMALHHVRDTRNMLLRWRELLRPGGLLLVGDLLPEDGGFHGGNNHDESAFHNGFDPEELHGLCEGLGLGVQRLLPFHIVRKPDATGAAREYPLFFLAARAV